FLLDGDLPVNPDGGLKSFGHPIGASGIRMVYEAYKQIQGKADKPQRQLKNVDMALVQCQGGVPGTFQANVQLFGSPDTRTKAKK
ncbi:MAG: acetyl-CoA acetyltransferase, partial [Dehalococcoidia bacterium]